MLQLSSQEDLPPEPLDVDTGGKLREQDLDRHFAAQRSLVRQVDPRHATAAQLAFNDVSRRQSALELFLKCAHRTGCASLVIRGGACETRASSRSPGIPECTRAAPVAPVPVLPRPFPYRLPPTRGAPTGGSQPPWRQRRCRSRTWSVVRRKASGAPSARSLRY